MCFVVLLLFALLLAPSSHCDARLVVREREVVLDMVKALRRFQIVVEMIDDVDVDVSIDKLAGVTSQCLVEAARFLSVYDDDNYTVSKHWPGVDYNLESITVDLFKGNSQTETVRCGSGSKMSRVMWKWAQYLRRFRRYTRLYYCVNSACDVFNLVIEYLDILVQSLVCTDSYKRLSVSDLKEEPFIAMVSVLEWVRRDFYISTLDVREDRDCVSPWSVYMCLGSR